MWECVCFDGEIVMNVSVFSSSLSPVVCVCCVCLLGRSRGGYVIFGTRSGEERMRRARAFKTRYGFVKKSRFSGESARL